MGRFTVDQAEHFGGSGGAGFFTLKNDGDVARVRFMYRDVNDVEGFAVHEIEVDGKRRYVNCIRDYNDPVDKCPFCAAQKFQRAKLFIPIYDEDDGRVKVWERGKKFLSKITSLCARYPDLVSHVFEIERNGKPGSTQTTYEIYEVSQDETTLEDLPEVPDVIGGIVLDKSADELQYFLDNGVFPDANEVADQVVRRRSAREDVRASRGGEERRDVGRRTPAQNRRREDVF